MTGYLHPPHLIYGNQLMEKTNVYSYSVQTFIRIISSIAIIILVISNTQRINAYDIKQLKTMHLEFFCFIINCITIILFFLYNNLSYKTRIVIHYSIFIWRYYSNIGTKK